MSMAGKSFGEHCEDCDGESSGKILRKVGLVYDEMMCKHDTPDGEDHPECPDRIRVIWEKLHVARVTQRCVVLGSSKAEEKHLRLVHTKDHVNLVKSISTKQKDFQRNKIASQLNSIYLNGGSSEAAYLAAGSVVEVAEKVAEGELDCGFAIVRPPGHHAEADEAMGFCLFNNVAVAASYLLNERLDLGVKKILIVDWDVHHGNGTQKMFWKDPHVLFFSVHRHEYGSFYPTGDDGDYNMVGEGPGEGFNINVPWEQARCGDADYLAAWDYILIPVVKEFNPDIILLSAGFDAAIGDPLGGCCVTPYGYSVMLKKLMEFARGKIVMALEGGYNLDSIAKSSLACVQVLLEDKPIQGSSETYPFESTWRVIQAVRKRLCTYWPSLADELPWKLINQRSPTPIIHIGSSDSETEDDAHEILDQMSKLNIENHLGTLLENHRVGSASTSWRADLAKVEVWYASYGSNMLKARFLCYIQGGQVEGMKKACVGSMDKSPPKEIMWETFPHRLFFSRESTAFWGVGGAAFTNPLTSFNDKTHMCLYRITLEQFNDVLFQENGLNVDSGYPLFDLAALQLVENKGSGSLEASSVRRQQMLIDTLRETSGNRTYTRVSTILQDRWYGNVVCLGKERSIPILTMTCTLSAVEKFRSGETPLRPPAKAYANTLVRGLVEGGIFSKEDAVAYIDNAASKPL